MTVKGVNGYMTWAELLLRWADILVRSLEYILSWPVAILIVGLCFFYKFKLAIEGFLNRMTEATFPGGCIKAINPQEQQQVETLINPKNEQEWILWVKQNPEQMHKYCVEISNQLKYERIMNIIYGTQIRLLENLEKKSKYGESIQNLQSYYVEFQRLGNNHITRFDEYLGFLQASNLIEIKENMAILTTVGQNFLIYIRSIYPGYSAKLY